MTILYFTGTGNSLYAAKLIGGNLLSIPQLIKDNQYEIKDDSVGIIFPCYGFNVPEIVERYISKANISADYLFAVMTYGGIPFSGLRQIEKIFAGKNQTLDYVNEVTMVNNILLTYKVEEQLEQKPLAQIDLKLHEIAADIRMRKQRHSQKRALSNLASVSFLGLERRLDISRMMTLRNFTVTDHCISCGICPKVCPAGNVTVKSQSKPEFGNNCLSCMACINNCPQNAIHHKRERSSVKYRNPGISLSEIIRSNNQDKAVGQQLLS